MQLSHATQSFPRSVQPAALRRSSDAALPRSSSSGVAALRRRQSFDEPELRRFSSSLVQLFDTERTTVHARDVELVRRRCSKHDRPESEIERERSERERSKLERNERERSERERSESERERAERDRAERERARAGGGREIA